jgi:hypothetical protein
VQKFHSRKNTLTYTKRRRLRHNRGKRAVRKKEEGRGKKEEGRGKREEGVG